MLLRPLILFIFTSSTYSFKFLAYNPSFGVSHTNFIAKISDTLVEAGHEVIMLMPITDPTLRRPKTKAKVIEIPYYAALNDARGLPDDMLRSFWIAEDPFSMLFQIYHMMTDSINQCNATVHHPGLIELLKAEKFDAAFSESLELCGFGLFELANIPNRAVTQTMAIVDGTFYFTQTPANTAYVPTLMVAPSGAEMSFMDRVWNTVNHHAMTIHNWVTLKRYQPIFEGVQPEFPPLEESVSSSSLIFMNSDPLLDFPAPRTSRIIDIGGISVSFGHNDLDEHWFSILSLRPRTILLSFGTVMQSYSMPDQYKQSIKEAIKKFPNVTFIWKYEKSEHNISIDVENIVETTWVPQHDLLNDPRLTAFITHGGQGSVTEANTAGVPVIVIPVITDQIRNAQQVNKNGLGIVVDKASLGTSKRLEEAITEILDNEKYRLTAKKTAKMLSKRPFAAKELFVRNMEFLAEFGPLRRLDHYGSQLNFIQLYLIDVFGFLALLFICFTFIVLALIRFSLRIICKVSLKNKQD